jgi:hypothetical protein
MIHTWKRSLVESAAEIFQKGHKSKKQNEAQVDELYRQIGKLQVECDFLSKRLSLYNPENPQADDRSFRVLEYIKPVPVLITTLNWQGFEVIF